MGEEDVASKKLEPVTNGEADVEKKAEVEEKSEGVSDKKGEQHVGVTEMEEDKTDDGKADAQQMDADKVEDEESKEIEEKAAKNGEEVEGKEETEADKEKQETAGEDGGKEQLKSKDVEDESLEKTKAGTEDKVADGVKEEQEKPEEPKEEKNSKKRPRSKIGAGKMDKNKKKQMVEEEKEQKAPADKKKKELKTSAEKKEKEPKTPSAPTIDRPVRERKSVERLVAIIEKDSSKEFHIEKGRGTALKDIPNVAYKLSRKKSDDTFKLLHTILFGRRGKAAQVKHNISRFSGFVWHDDEEKQMIKVKEKLDKCVKEKLVEFCDVLDIPISKANTRKEDIIAKLIEFLVEPHATTSDLLAEKEQGKKRKRVSKLTPGSSTKSKGSAKQLILLPMNANLL
ncbi:hypothetical protein CDL12_29912 [Handroanthus impetiginosus]|uniref:DEK C-terminal domain-containing protein n=1 Tax=Handroanthus impetiginosus TaxID=429701 RepID=A0A2G9FX37_9LAMI|nr:hypothetical protein CDL12_29912 [Handroanthus impetiginosus]